MDDVWAARAAAASCCCVCAYEEASGGCAARAGVWRDCVRCTYVCACERGAPRGAYGDMGIDPARGGLELAAVCTVDAQAGSVGVRGGALGVPGSCPDGRCLASLDLQLVGRTYRLRRGGAFAPARRDREPSWASGTAGAARWGEHTRHLDARTGRPTYMRTVRRRRRREGAREET